MKKRLAFYQSPCFSLGNLGATLGQIATTNPNKKSP